MATRTGSLRLALALLAICLLTGAIAAGVWLVTSPADKRDGISTAAPESAHASSSVSTSTGRRATEGQRHEVHFARPSGPPRVATDHVDSLGRPVTVSCSSCHGNLAPNPAIRSGADLTQFHQGLKTTHGDLTCLTCHDPKDYDRLRLADSSPVPYSDVVALCSQCHASVAKDYQFGAHGGSSGHWDLTRGPQHRKNCIDCHDPHAPAFPSMRPTFHPRDRFLETKSEGKPHE